MPLQRHVLFINRVYPPDRAATGQMLAGLAAALARRGWRVSVVAQHTVPAAPRRERLDGVEVYRVRGLAFTRASTWRRGLSYLSLYPLLLWAAWRAPRAGLVVTMTDPPLQQLPGVLLAGLTGAGAVHWAQDVYPELAVELGVLRPGGRPARALTALSTWGLRRHRRIVAIGRCMAARLRARGLAEDRIAVVPNWADPAQVRPDGGAGFRAAHGLGDGPLVMYSGNLGLAHPFAQMLDAAAALPEATFAFVGDGPRLAWVQEQAAARGLDNVRFLPFQPPEALAASLSAADLHLASMEPRLAGLVVPSKVYGVMAAGRPCLFIGPAESEAARVLVEHDCGGVADPADGAGLTAAIRDWLADPARRAAAGTRARAAAEAAGPDQAAAAFEAVLNEAR